MSENKTIKNVGLVTFTVKVGGSPIPDENRVYSIDIVNDINKIAKATITIIDGDPSTGKFEASSSSTFIPGGLISIEAGYDTKNTLNYYRAKHSN